jgi:hypothetical protein
MSCGIGDSTIAMNTTDGIAVSAIPKYRKPNRPTAACDDLTSLEISS